MSRRSDRLRRYRRRDRVELEHEHLFEPGEPYDLREPRRVLGGTARGGVVLTFDFTESGKVVVVVGDDVIEMETVTLETADAMTVDRLLGAIIGAGCRGAA